jgi:hypothetical protein
MLAAVLHTVVPPPCQRDQTQHGSGLVGERLLNGHDT